MRLMESGRKRLWAGWRFHRCLRQSGVFFAGCRFSGFFGCRHLVQFRQRPGGVGMSRLFRRFQPEACPVPVSGDAVAFCIDRPEKEHGFGVSGAGGDGEVMDGAGNVLCDVNAQIEDAAVEVAGVDMAAVGASLEPCGGFVRIFFR